MIANRPLTLISTEGGCAAKLGPSDLHYILDELLIQDPVAYKIIRDNDDAGKLMVGNSTIVQSIDAITPICDDPHTFGGIAVVHALSDIYAVGAKPLAALFILGLPRGLVSLETSRAILQGGIDKLYELDCKLLGGHTLETKQQLFFGISVTGLLVSENRVESRCQEGDILLLTKPLGSGIISTALKFRNGGLEVKEFSDLYVQDALKIMLETNLRPSQISLESGMHACTDVTGFGLLGHLCQLLSKANVSAALDVSKIPIFAGVTEFSQQGIFSAGSDRNLAYWGDKVSFERSVALYQKMILFDPQTSGGLLMSVPEKRLDGLLDKFSAAGLTAPAIIGKVVPRSSFLIRV